jgi:hypothetical protein
MEPDALELVTTWHRLLNEGKIDELVTLIHPGVEVGGPRGAGHGMQLFRDWFGRDGIQLVPVRCFRRGNTVLMGENGTWHVQSDGQPASSQSQVGANPTPTGTQTAGSSTQPGTESASNNAQPRTEPAGSRTVWTVFTVTGGLIAGIWRFDDLASAMERAGLAEADEVA